jgi:single-stranded DNA-binding protein
VVGEVVLREYQAKDGTTKSSLELTCDRLTLLGGRDSASEAPPARSEAQPTRTPQRGQDAGLPAGSGDMDDIPF